MASNPRGVPPLGPALIRPTLPEPEPVADDEPGDQVEGQGGPTADARPIAPRVRRRRADRPAEKTSKRGLYLARGVWERLQLEAIRRQTTVSAVAGDILERNLPRLRIERD
jgi:hypothetical protein